MTTLSLSPQVRLILKERLDRELAVRHMVQLIVVDGGRSPLSGSTTIVINVLDANDNRPTFVGGTSFELTVAENTPQETVVLRLEAHDPDEGRNGFVEYRFSASTLGSPGGRVFAVRNDTGEIVVRVSTTKSSLCIIKRDLSNFVHNSAKFHPILKTRSPP